MTVIFVQAKYVFNQRRDSVRKIKICIILFGFENGGAEAVTYNYFSHMDLSKFEVHMIAHDVRVGKCKDLFCSMGFKIHIIPSKRQFFNHIAQMNKIFREERFDIIHANTTEWACIAMILGKLNHVPVRINHSHMAEKPNGLVNQLYYSIRLYLGKKFATHYFACGRDAGIYLFGLKAVDNGEVTIIPNAIEFEKFQYFNKIRTSMRSEAELGKKTTVIGHVGRFSAQKNHAFLLQIFQAYHKQNSDSIILLFGDGVLRQAMETKVKQMGLEKSVRFMGIHSDMACWYQAMDIFVLPSLYEGLPLVGVEAQANGLPCLFSDTITSEIRLSDRAVFMSLKDSPKQWANIINEMVSSIERGNVTLDHTYDISVAAKRLERFYIQQSGKIAH